MGLSAIGIYGVLAFSVVRRTREIGIRIAVGASRSSVVAIFLKEAGRLVGAGVLLGLPLALACGRAAESLLYGLLPQDTGTMAGATGILLVFVAVASVLPAWRAARAECRPCATPRIISALGRTAGISRPCSIRSQGRIVGLPDNGAASDFAIDGLMEFREVGLCEG